MLSATHPLRSKAKERTSRKIGGGEFKLLAEQRAVGLGASRPAVFPDQVARFVSR